MSFPSIPSTPSFIPSDLQKNALSALQSARASGTAMFANPLDSHVNSLMSTAQEPGGLKLGEMSAAVGGISGFRVLDTTPNAAVINAELESFGVEWSQHTKYFGLDKIGDAHSFMNDDIKNGILQQQNTQVVGKMQDVIHTTEGVARAKEMFGNVNPDGTAEKSVCDNIKDFAGSLGGAVDDIVDQAKGAMKELDDMFSKASSAVKTAVNSAITYLTTTFNDLKSQLEAGVTTALTELRTAFNALKTNVSSFMSDVATAVGKTVEQLKSAVSDAVSAVKEGLSDMADKIKEELANLSTAQDYLKDVATAMSFPSLSPCAKQIIGATAGAAGAVALVKLVG